MQPFEDPFGDGPFKAIPSPESFSNQQQNVSPSFHPSSSQSELQQPNFQDNNSGFGETDILADILPPPGSSPGGFSAQTVQSASQTGFASQTKEPETGFEGEISQPAASTAGFQSQPGQSLSLTGFPAQVTYAAFMREYPEQAGQPSQQAGFPYQSGQYSSFTGFPSQASSAQPAWFPPSNQPSQQAGFPHQSGQYSSVTGFPSQASSTQPASFSPPNRPSQPGPNYNVNFNQQPEFAASAVESMAAQSPSRPPGPAPQMQPAESNPVMASASSEPTNYLAIVPQPAKEKFETKSTIWKDTLNRGLVDLNISGREIAENFKFYT